MIIGLTGKNGSGKGVIADQLKVSGFVAVSLSDVIRDDLKERGVEVTRENLIEAGNALRHNGGAAVLAEKILAKLDADKNYVVDSIRNPAEVLALKRRSDFRLLLVTAGEAVRCDRVKRRGRESDPKSLEEFRRLEAAEMTSNDPAKQQLGLTEKLADASIDNNGTLGELYEKLPAVLQKLAQSIARPSWDTYFMKIAQTVALRSNCVKRKVAAIIVKDRRIISTGYNGTPRGLKNCDEGGCPRCNSFGKSGQGLEDCFCSHAEENAIVQAAYHGVNISGASLYTTFSPCLLCTKMILNSGINEVVYSKQYAMGNIPLSQLDEAHIRHRQVDTQQA